MLIAGLDSENLVLLIAHLGNREKKDFDISLINNNIEISINKAFIEHDLNFDETDDTNSNNKD